ncbi:MAG: hypothetical protein NT068_00615 [Candidatus Nomurabacteria bacterium]|nr:hypothetical protein [Candidatus Nomurabacteria bacterium]
MKNNFSTLDFKALDHSMLEGPIVTSLLEDDFYKFSMGGLLHDFPEYGEQEMEWRFKCRTKIPLGDYITEKDFMEQYEHVTKLHATKTELHYLRGTNEYDTRMFSEGYLKHLTNLQIPNANFHVTNEKDLDIAVAKSWNHSMHAEMPILKIVNTLFYRTQLKKMSRMEREAIYAEGVRRLAETIMKIKAHSNVRFSDFGNRRAFGPVWHDYVVARCAEELGEQFLGTSNVALAAKYDLMPIGTCAHELSMGITATHFDGTKKSIEDSLLRLANMWWNKYGHGLSINLPDTYGTTFTLGVMTEQMHRDWKGNRIDSKAPTVAIKELMAKYDSLGIDPATKMAIPSDGNTVDSMIEVADAFHNKMKVSFGFGTWLTNNMGLLQLSIVAKPWKIGKKYCVKVSDNRAKSIGEENEKGSYIKALDSNETYFLEPVV